VSNLTVTLRLGSEGSLPDLWYRRLAAAEFADFELPLFDLLCQFDATDDYRGGSKALSAQHRTKTLLDSSMVLLDQVVQVFTAAEHTRFGSSPFSFRSAAARRVAA
jgi:hypothetical protein